MFDTPFYSEKTVAGHRFYTGSVMISRRATVLRLPIQTIENNTVVFPATVYAGHP